jgi:hypothetical protein
MTKAGSSWKLQNLHRPSDWMTLVLVGVGVLRPLMLSSSALAIFASPR